MTWEEQVHSAVDIERVLSRLSPEELETVILHYCEDLTYKEMTEQLGWAYRRAKRRISGALFKIRASRGVVVPEKPDDADDAMGCNTWWPFVLRSLRRRTRKLHFLPGTRGNVCSERPPTSGK